MRSCKDRLKDRLVEILGLPRLVQVDLAAA